METIVDQLKTVNSKSFLEEVKNPENINNLIKKRMYFNQKSTKMFELGNFFLWVDSTGDLRVATTKPTNLETGGAIVGTQS